MPNRVIRNIIQKGGGWEKIAMGLEYVYGSIMGKYLGWRTAWKATKF